MFKIVKCRGMLLKAMNKNVQHISFIAFMIGTVPLLILCFVYGLDSHMTKVFSGLLLWFMVSLFLLNKISWDDDNHTNKILTLPVWLSLKLSVLIFRFFLKRKYPEMEEEHYLRWVKLKKLKKQIKTK